VCECAEGGKEREELWDGTFGDEMGVGSGECEACGVRRVVWKACGEVGVGSLGRAMSMGMCRE
jgi:hypothetical protein